MNLKLNPLCLLLVFSVLVTTGCQGGGNSQNSNPNPPSNQQANITAPSSISLNQNGSVTFTVRNVSPSTAATQIKAVNLPANVTSTTCNATPDGSCDLTLSSNSAPITIQSIDIQGNNTSLVNTELNVTNIPLKNIEIYNNSPSETIYPVLEASNHPFGNTDAWLQAQFGESDVTNTFINNNVYRIYVNPSQGIPPGQSVILQVPFYSQLVDNPQPSSANQYIDWWNGMRVYLYDAQANLQYTRQYMDPHDIPVTPKSAALACLSDNCEAFTTYSNTIGLPPGDPYQLTEYTFANVVKSSVPYHIYPNYVDYDISYVDHVYLPVAMQPLDNPTIGYTGTVMELSQFEPILHYFSDHLGWPHYIPMIPSGSNPPTPPPAYPNLRLPGTYNLIAESQINDSPLVPSNSQALQNLETLWTNNQNSSFASVNGLFQSNYTNYLNTCNPPGNPSPTPDLISLLENVYGWVPFQAGTCTNDLSATPNIPNGLTYDQVVADYKALQYNYSTAPSPTDAFNPYTMLIHDQNYLDMNAYAFSIDDAAGNMNETGDGLIITVSGEKGLDNARPYNPGTVATVNLGNPNPNPNPWTNYGICSDTANTSLAGGASFQVATVNYPCKITVEDSHKNLYQFTLLAPPPFLSSNPSSQYLSCSNSTSPSWCQGVRLDTDTSPPGANQNVDAPALS